MRRAAIALTTTLALTATACGAGGPALTSEDEVLTALLALEDGATTRVTLDLVVDEDELRDAMRDDAEARALVADALDATDEDVDLAAAAARLQDSLAGHVAVVRVADDHSAAFALEHEGQEWLDLRIRSEADAGDDLREGVELDLQARFDAEVAARALDDPALTDGLDELLGAVGPLLGSPEVAELGAVVTGLLAGRLVGVTGVLDPSMLAGAAPADATVGLGAGAGLLGLPATDVDPRAFADTLLTIDGFRADGDATVADVSLELRAAAEQLAEATGEPLPPEADDLPATLVDVATLTVGDDGVVRGARIDALTIVAQLAGAAPEADADAAVVARLADRLETTGLFLDVEVTQVGAVATVLGDPAATITFEQLVEQGLGLFLLGGLGGAFGGDEAALGGLGAGAAGSDGAALFELFGDLDEGEQLTAEQLAELQTLLEQPGTEG